MRVPILTVLTLLAAGLIVGCADEPAPDRASDPTPGPTDRAATETSSMTGEPIVLAVEGMTCAGCAGSIRSAVVELPMVNGVSVSLDDDRATVYVAKADDATKATVAESINKLGYTATAQ